MDYPLLHGVHKLESFIANAEAKYTTTWLIDVLAGMPHSTQSESVRAIAPSRVSLG